MAVASALLAGLLLWFGVPAVAGASWPEIAVCLAEVKTLHLGALGVLWLTSQWAYTIVQCGAWPGLTTRRALALNFGGSAICNVLPLGAAVALVFTFGIARTWGYPRRAVSPALVLNQLFAIAGRLGLLVIGIAAFLASPDLAAVPVAPAGLALGILLGGLTLAIVILRSEGTALRTGQLVERLVGLVPRVSCSPGRAGAAISRIRQDVVRLAGSTGRRMLAGLVIHLLLQALVFLGCLGVSGGWPGLSPAMAAFVLGRILTSSPATPSGVGVAETGTLALLVAAGAPASPAAAGVLLFSCFAYVLEIPVGGLVILWWLGQRKPSTKSLSQPSVIREPLARV